MGIFIDKVIMKFPHYIDANEIRIYKSINDNRVLLKQIEDSLEE